MLLKSFIRTEFYMMRLKKIFDENKDKKDFHNLIKHY